MRCHYSPLVFPDVSLPQSAPGLLDWSTVHDKLSWGVVIVLGGGFALADATQVKDEICAMITFLQCSVVAVMNRIISGLCIFY